MKNVNAKAAMWLPISPVDEGGVEIKAIDPMESESPKTRSASASILGRGRFSLGSISRQDYLIHIWSFVNRGFSIEGGLSASSRLGAALPFWTRSISRCTIFGATETLAHKDQIALLRVSQALEEIK